MATNANLLRRPSDRGLFLAAAAGFPLLVLIGYFRSYYFSAFFGTSVANALVHAHGLVMTLWVAYFTAQVLLIRSKSVKLHMRMGMAGVALAALVVVVGMATAYDAQLVRAAAPPWIDPRGFFFYPVSDMTLFVVFFAAAIYYRKRPAEHKSLMLLTAVNFLPAALFRVSPVPEQPTLTILWAFGLPALLAVVCLAWFTARHRKLNRVFAAGVAVLIAMLPLRMVVSESAVWLRFVALIAP